MKLREDPIQTQFKPTAINDHFVVLSQERNVATVIPKDSSSVSLGIGNLIRFTPEVVGIVTAKNNTSYTVLLNIDRPVKEGVKVKLA